MKNMVSLAKKSFDLSGWKIGKMRDARDFVEGISKLGNGNELLALRCLKKAVADENKAYLAWARLAGRMDPIRNPC